MQPSEPLSTSNIHATQSSKRGWYARRGFMLFVGGLLLGIILALVIGLLISNRGKQVRISCHRPTTQNTQTEYCVYFKRGHLLIGTTGSNGLKYTIPYGQNDVSVSWDNNTDAATITLPSTKLIIQASEYTSKR